MAGKKSNMNQDRKGTGMTSSDNINQVQSTSDDTNNVSNNLNDDQSQGQQFNSDVDTNANVDSESLDNHTGNVSSDRANRDI